MNFTKIALAAAVTLVAAQANAAPVYLAGASATAANYRSALTSLCSGTTTIITYNGALTANITKASNLFAVKCSTSFTGLPGIDVVNFNVDGGSFTALTTSVGNDSAQFLDTATIVGSGTTATSANLIAARKSEGGFLDIDAAAFPADQFTAFAIPDGTASTPAKFSQVFGVAVSPALYTALQTAQGITANVDAWDAASQPTISKAQYASIVSDAFNSAKTKGANFLVSSLAAGTKLTVCRRVSTSGTQASSNQFFLNSYVGGDGAAVGALAPADAANYASANSGLTSFDVIENGTTGNARDCLSNGSTYAIGVLSLENYPQLAANATGSNADRKYRFVKVNGVAAFNNSTNSLETAKAGSYEFFFNSNKFGATTNGTAVVNAIDSQLGGVNLKGLFGIPAGSDTATAKRETNTSPIVFN